MTVKKAVIPAAGFGTRMLPATKTVPKEMLPLAGKPSLQWIVEEAVASGIEDILIITGRGKDVMEDYFDYIPELEEFLKRRGREEEAEVVRRVADMANLYFIRQKQALGLGHAVYCAKSFVGEDHFAVLLGDDIMMSDRPVTGQLIEAAERCDGCAVGVKRVPDADVSKYCSLGVDAPDGSVMRVRRLIEKPSPAEKLSNYAILGRYVLPREIFSILENQPTGYGGEIQLTDALDVLCRSYPMYAVDFEGRRFDTGNPCGYLEAVLEFSLKNPDTADWLRNYMKNRF